jgi:choline dehydrogenase-like flavoprotein
VLAARLAEAGWHVVVLEEGGFHSGEDFDDDEGRLAPRLYADAAARATDDLSVILLQGRCVGGGSTVNWMMTLRPQPWVLDEWEREHRLELLSARSLEPALTRIEQEIHARPLPDDAHSPANRLIIDGCARLGWRTLAARVNAVGCVRAGACGLGCRWGAKQSAGEVYLPRALRAGATVCCDARADRIDVLERGTRLPLKRVTVTALDAARTPVGRLHVEARIVVLAAGAVGTPALLELSGLSTGGSGRWLRLHPTTGVFGTYDRPIYAAAGVPQTAVCAEFMQGDDGYGFWIECAPLRPGLLAAALQGFGEPHRERMRGYARLGPLIVLVRDGAERQRSSGDVRVDRRGRIRIRYRIADTDRRRLALGVRAAARLHLANGALSSQSLHVDATPVRTDADLPRLAQQRYSPNRLSLFSAHVNGTCRLGHAPRDSGCTPDGEVHGTNGIYVADGSLFPTAPGVNPQATIMALASLIAERVQARLERA